MKPTLRAGTASLLALLLSTGCSLVNRTQPPAADLSGTYSGVLRLEGEEMPAMLRVEQDGGRMTATLSSDVGLDADGRGSLQGTVLRLEFEYDNECSGELTLAGQALDDGDRLVGTVEVEDCTGPVEGSFSLSRR